MQLASAYIQDYSDSEDYVSMSDDEMEVGMQMTRETVEADVSSDECEDLFASMPRSRMEIEEEAEDERRMVTSLRRLSVSPPSSPVRSSARAGRFMVSPVSDEEMRTTDTVALPHSAVASAPTSGGGGGGAGSSVSSFFSGLLGGIRGSAMASQESEAAKPSRSSSKSKSDYKRKKKALRLRSAMLEKDKARRQRADRKVAARQKVNARVISVDLGTVGEEAALATGDPFICGNHKCKAILSKFDNLIDLSDIDYARSLAKKAEEKKDDEKKEEGSDEDDDGLDANKLWICAFCGHHNLLEIEDEEFPTEDTLDFLVEPPLSEEEKAKEQKIVVFTIDTSGSMCVTTSVDGTFEMRTPVIDESLRAFIDDGSDQFLPGQKRRGVTWVSRLALVQTAIESQVKELSKTHSKYKIALCSFSDDIKVWGTGEASEAVFVAGDKLKDLPKLKEIGESCVLGKTIDEAQESLIEKLYSLKESGQTCLGPALVVSIAIAAKSRPVPSTVVLATDGLANIGLGSLDGLTDEEMDAVEEWYNSVARWAQECGVTCNVLSISDAQCRLENLGKVADMTGGEVDQVDPTTLRSRFSGILSRKVIATKAQATMLLHPVCGFAADEDEDDPIAKARAIREAAPPVIDSIPEAPPALAAPVSIERETSGARLPTDPSDRASVAEGDVSSSSAVAAASAAEAPIASEAAAAAVVEPGASAVEAEEKEDDVSSKRKMKAVVSSVAVDKQVRDVGNIIKDDESSRLFFEFNVKKDLKKTKYKDLKEVIMQVQVSFVREDGAKMLRVITQTVPLTSDKQKVLDSLAMDVLGDHVSRRAAALCEDGDYEKARQVTYASSIWMNRNARTMEQSTALGTYMERNMMLDGMMQSETVAEKSSGLKYESKAKKKKARSRARDDGFSKMMYKSKKGWQ